MPTAPNRLTFAVLLLAAGCQGEAPAPGQGAGGAAGDSASAGAGGMQAVGQAPSANAGNAGTEVASGGTGAPQGGVATGGGGAAPVAGAAGAAGGPEVCVRPTAATTGLSDGDVLTASGGKSLTQAGATLENLDITGDVQVSASNVTIRNCRIHGHVTIGNQATGTLIEQSEIIGPVDATSAQPGVGTHDFMLRRVNMRGFTVFVRALSGAMRVERSLLHAPCSDQQGELVTGVAGYVPGPGSLSLYCNVIDMNATDAACKVQIDHSLQLNHQDEPAQGLALEVDHNYLDGGNYSVNLEQGFVSIAMTNNRWGRAAEYGPALIDHLQLQPPATLVWQNNAFDDDSSPIPAP